MSSFCTFPTPPPPPPPSLTKIPNKHKQKRQALLNNLDESSSTEDVIECLAACPQLCTEERRALAKDMSPTTKPILRRLVARGASSLRSAVPRESGRTARNGGGKGKGKGRGRGKGGSSAGKGKHGSGGSNGAVAEESVGVGEATEDTGEVEEEFFSKGRRGEGNRRAARSSSDLKEVMTHNLIVLLSALYREGVVVDSAVDSDTASSNSADDDSGNEDKPHRDGDDEKSAAETATGATEGNGIASGGLAGAAAMTEAQAQAARALSDEQEALFGLAEPLLDACLRVAAERESPRLLGTVVEAKAMLRRRLWSSEDGEALSAQAAETDLDLDAAVPRVKVKVSVAIRCKGWTNSTAVGYYADAKLLEVGRISLLHRRQDRWSHVQSATVQYSSNPIIGVQRRLRQCFLSASVLCCVFFASRYCYAPTHFLIRS